MLSQVSVITAIIRRTKNNKMLRKKSTYDYRTLRQRNLSDNKSFFLRWKRWYQVLIFWHLKSCLIILDNWCSLCTAGIRLNEYGSRIARIRLYELSQDQASISVQVLCGCALIRVHELCGSARIRVHELCGSAHRWSRFCRNFCNQTG